MKGDSRVKNNIIGRIFVTIEAQLKHYRCITNDP